MKVLTIAVTDISSFNEKSYEYLEWIQVIDENDFLARESYCIVLYVY